MFIPKQVRKYTTCVVITCVHVRYFIDLQEKLLRTISCFFCSFFLLYFWNSKTWTLKKDCRIKFLFKREPKSKLLAFTLQIVLDNRAHSGKVKIHLENRAKIKECKDPSVSGQGEKKQNNPNEFKGDFEDNQVHQTDNKSTIRRR